MSITPGFTTAEIRELVHEYQLVAHGQKAAWLALRGLRYHHVIKWRKAVFGGNLDRGLVPRQARGMTLPPKQRTELAKQRAAERAEHEANDLRADILHLCRAVQAHRAGNIAQKARDAEAHVRGVAERR